ncbi:capsular exopolysaccharide family protein [Chitinispirillum alkaliphilum]|nr:capsular exopolysaccharide family protein [Chitinispirillum alkaliphilum]
MNGINETLISSRPALKDYLAIMMRRRLIIFFAFISVAASTYFYVDSIEDVFEAYSTVVIEDQGVSVNPLMQTNVRPLSFYEGILNSRSFLEMLLDSIGVEIFSEVFPEYSRDQIRGYIHSNISLRRTPYSSFLRLNARGKTKEMAYMIAGIGTELLRDRCQEVESEESRRALKEIENQLGLIRDNLEEAEYEYRKFKDRTGQIQDGTTPGLKTLQEAYGSSLANLGLKEADLEAERNQLANLENKITPDRQRSPEFLRLRSRLRELETERMRLENLGIRFSGLSNIDREIKDTERQLLQFQRQTSSVDPAVMRQWQELRKSVINKEAELELFKRRLDSYENAIQTYKQGNPHMLSESLELIRLQRSREVYENIYNILLSKAEEQRIKSRSSGMGLKIVDMPEMPQAPMPKNEAGYYTLGILLGLGLGISLAFLAEYNDTTIKTNEDVEKYLRLSVLGTIPHIVCNKKKDIEVRRFSSKKKDKLTVNQYPRQVFTFTGDDSVITEAYRSLRTNLSFVSPDNPVQTVLLTSAGPGEGKSLTVSNLAMAYAQMGKKILLVDADLRRPVQHHIFGMKREPGFSELFIDNPDYEKIIRPTGRENLYLISAGIFTPNPAELVGSQKMVQIIDDLKARFDMIFFDTPPIIAVTDAALLGTKVDGLLMVIKSHHTDRDIAYRAMNSLKNIGVKIYGTVLNDINLSDRYTSYGYYKYYYHYYKTKKD